ncbi:MAG: phosphoethanolamine transferase [Sulfurimonas sp.]|nr:phosphoethanolamine transferase [Sulfurimonas sp.]
MIQKFKNEVRENKNYIYLSYLLSFLTMLPQLIASALSDVEHLLFLGILFFVLIFISKFHKLLFAIFVIYINLTNILIGHIFFHWGYAKADIGPRIEVSAISPLYESVEYLMTYIDYRDILLLVYTFFVLAFLYKILVHYRHSFRFIRFLGFIVATSTIVAFSYYSNPLQEHEPLSIPNKYIYAQQHTEIFDKRSQYLESLESAVVENNASIYDKIIIIQGESVNKHHMSIYGYAKKTTPYFSALKAKKKIYVFNAIAPTDQTRFSMPILHSQASVHDYEEAFVHSRSIVGEFRLHNYKTYWISNQGEAGEHDTSISSMAQEADVRHFENLDYISAQTDEALLPYIVDIRNNADKELYFIHLMGSHADYDKRYSKTNMLFSDPQNIQEEYDNSIHYTDSILETLFAHFTQKFADKKILIVYLSDHGEIVHKSRHGHGFMPPFKEEFDIPFVLYSNIKNSRIEELYKKNKKHYFNLENLTSMIAFINGLSDDANISTSKDVFALAPENIFDYDTLKFYKD